MKKMISLLSAMLLMSSTTLGVSSVINDNISQNKTTNDIYESKLENESLNWKDINLNLKDELNSLKKKDFSKMNYFSNLNENNNFSLSDEQIERIEITSLEILDQVKNIDTKDEVLEKLFEISPEFKEEFNNSLLENNVFKEETNNFSIKTNNFQNLGNYYNNIDDINNELAGIKYKAEKTKEQLALLQTTVVLASTASIVSGILAASYWANVWWTFGASAIPAVAATTISVITSAYAIYTDNKINRYRGLSSGLERIVRSIIKNTGAPKLSTDDIRDSILDAIGIWDTIVGVNQLYLYYTYGFLAAGMSAGWASPTVFGVLGLVGSVVTLIEILIK